jgi:MFS family permease
MARKDRIDSSVQRPDAGETRVEATAVSANGMNSKSRLPAALRALRHPNYRLFFFGQLISLIGTWMQGTAQSWLVYQLTNDPAMLGLVGFMNTIPVLIFSPIAGTVADRYDRRWICVGTQVSAMLLAFILAALTLTGSVHVYHVMILATLLGVVNAFDIPTRQAFVVQMVGREDLFNAIALNSSVINGARIVGPAVAGVVVEAVGEGWCFFMNGISYVAVIAGLLLMTITAESRPSLLGSALSNIIDGFQYVRRTKPIRTLLLLLGLVSLTGMPYAVLMPVFVDEILHGGPRALGLLMGSAGIGALTAALVLAMRRGVDGLQRWVGFAGAGFGACLILFSLSRFFWLSLALLVPTGFCMMVGLTASNTLIQSIVPDHLRGRVMAVYSMMFLGMAPFGALLAGVLAKHLGAPATVRLGGIICIVGATIFGWRLANSAPVRHRIIEA